jgi:hypothetical protein
MSSTSCLETAESVEAPAYKQPADIYPLMQDNTLSANVPLDCHENLVTELNTPLGSQ